MHSHQRGDGRASTFAGDDDSCGIDRIVPCEIRPDFFNAVNGSEGILAKRIWPIPTASDRQVIANKLVRRINHRNRYMVTHERPTVFDSLFGSEAIFGKPD